MCFNYKLLNYPRLTDMPITTGSSFSPSAFTKNAHVIHCFPFSPPVHRLPLASRVLSGRPRQKQPLSFRFQTSQAFHPLGFPCALVPSSHSTVLLQILYFCLTFSHQPLEVTKLEISNVAAINIAFSWSIEPETRMSVFLHIVYQSHRV